MGQLSELPFYCLDEIFRSLDPVDARAASFVSSRFYQAYNSFYTQLQPAVSFPPTAGASHAAAPSVTFAPGTATGPSHSSNHADYDSLANTDTEMSATPSEDEWEFEITPEVVRRLSLIPPRNHDATLEFLPTELQFMIFKELDKIDSCCLGLAHPNLYVVHRAIHGTKMPLNTRRIGPNSLESAWEVVGRQECKQCGVYRCELHAHIKTWMPANLEYCAMKQNFGFPARNGAPDTCYRGKPSKPRRCGRHPTRTTSVHQDDAHFSIC